MDPELLARLFTFMFAGPKPVPSHVPEPEMDRSHRRKAIMYQDPSTWLSGNRPEMNEALDDELTQFLNSPVVMDTIRAMLPDYSARVGTKYDPRDDLNNRLGYTLHERPNNIVLTHMPEHQNKKTREHNAVIEEGNRQLGTNNQKFMPDAAEVLVHEMQHARDLKAFWHEMQGYTPQTGLRRNEPWPGDQVIREIQRGERSTPTGRFANIFDGNTNDISPSELKAEQLREAFSLLRKSADSSMTLPKLMQELGQAEELLPGTLDVLEQLRRMEIFAGTRLSPATFDTIPRDMIQAYKEQREGN